MAPTLDRKVKVTAHLDSSQFYLFVDGVEVPRSHYQVQIVEGPLRKTKFQVSLTKGSEHGFQAIPRLARPQALLQLFYTPIPHVLFKYYEHIVPQPCSSVIFDT